MSPSLLSSFCSLSHLQFVEGLPLIRTGDDTWAAVLYLTPGTYYYYFVVNEETQTRDYSRDAQPLPVEFSKGGERPMVHKVEVEFIAETPQGDAAFGAERGLGYFAFEWYRSDDELQFVRIEDCESSPVCLYDSLSV